MVEEDPTEFGGKGSNKSGIAPDNPGDASGNSGGASGDSGKAPPRGKGWANPKEIKGMELNQQFVARVGENGKLLLQTYYERLLKITVEEIQEAKGKGQADKLKRVLLSTFAKSAEAAGWALSSEFYQRFRNNIDAAARSLLRKHDLDSIGDDAEKFNAFLEDLIKQVTDDASRVIGDAEKRNGLITYEEAREQAAKNREARKKGTAEKGVLGKMGPVGKAALGLGGGLAAVALGPTVIEGIKHMMPGYSERKRREALAEEMIRERIDRQHQMEMLKMMILAQLNAKALQTMHPSMTQALAPQMLGVNMADGRSLMGGLGGGSHPGLGVDDLSAMMASGPPLPMGDVIGGSIGGGGGGGGDAALMDMLARDRVFGGGGGFGRSAVL